MMNEQSIPVYDAKLFSWYHASRTACIEASDLRGLGISTLAQFFSRVYDDACDVGFGLRSGTTGKTVYFILDEIKAESDREIACWEFRVAQESANRHPSLKDWTVVIFND